MIFFILILQGGEIMQIVKRSILLPMSFNFKRAQQKKEKTLWNSTFRAKINNDDRGRNPLINDLLQL